MTRYFLTGVKIEGFRGINNESDPLELRFRPDAVNSIFAVSGGGKSSIFEALSYAIRGIVPRLEPLQAQERPEDYFCNRFHSTGTAKIELELHPDDGTKPIMVCVERDAEGNRAVTRSSGHPNPVTLLNSLNEDFALLDYRTFNKFIDSTPLERGRSFSALLGLSIYSDFRQTLQAVSETRALNSDLELTTLRTQVADAQQAEQRELRQLMAAYNGMTGTQITDVTDIGKCADEILTALAGIDLIKDNVAGKLLKELDFAAIKEQIKTAEGGEKRKLLEAAIAKITELDGLGEPDASTGDEKSNPYRALQKKADLLA